MANNKKNKARNVKQQIREKINKAVSEAFSGHCADFCGGVEQSRMAKRGRTMGFRVKDSSGKCCSNIIWINPEYEGHWSVDWIKDAVKKSNS